MSKPRENRLPGLIAPGYVGRFAPSPSGPLHFGSLVAALASFLDARAHQGLWRLRMEDIDPPREQPGAADDILRCLEAHGLHWDGEVLYQSTRHDAYREALTSLENQQLSYRCTCSRQDLQGEPIYNGHCRALHHSNQTVSAIRLNVEKSVHALNLNPVMEFDDVFQGKQQQNILTEVGDFVIHRKDGLFAYQLAVVVDDIFQNITQVIRGADLLDSTARQIVLFHLLGTDLNLSPIPTFGHVPLVLNTEGQKLSKQNLAPAINHHTPEKNIFRALQFLQQSPPAELQKEAPAAILDWAIQHWQLASLKGLE